MNINSVPASEVKVDDIVVDLPSDPLFHKILKVKSIVKDLGFLFFNGYNGNTIKITEGDNILKIQT